MENTVTSYNVSTLPSNYNTYIPSRNLDPFFDVTRLPLFAKGESDNKEIERDALFSPTGDMLGVVSKNYKVVNNYDVASLFDEFFSDMSIYQVKDMVSGNGGKWLREYIVDEDKYSVTVDNNDELKLKVIISNGYDAKSGVKFDLAFWRQVCSNGMMGWRKQVGTRFSHFSDGILDKLEGLLNKGFSNVSEFANTWQSWNKIPFGKKEFEGFVNSRDYLSDKKKKNTIGYYEPIMSKFGEKETKWGSYNVLTAIATHYTSARDNNVANVFSNGYREMERVTRDFWNY